VLYVLAWLFGVVGWLVVDVNQVRTAAALAISIFCGVEMGVT
jgi:hypothetical protein